MRLALWPEYSSGEHQAEMELTVADPTNQMFVAARPDGRLGGFLEFGQRKYAEGCDTSPVGYIEGWYVDADLRRQQVGGALVRAAEAWARQQGLREMASDCLLDNSVSEQAHLSIGYQEVERLITFRKSLG
jgi:aminoglycoside 6'-N-acetyltransferase I